MGRETTDKKEFLWQQYLKGNLVWKKKPIEVDKRKLKGQREPRNITEALLELFFYHWLEKWTINGAIEAALKTPDFKIIFNKKIESLSKNKKRTKIDAKKWFEKSIYREYKNNDLLQRMYINQKGKLMKVLIERARGKRFKDLKAGKIKKADFYPGSY